MERIGEMSISFSDLDSILVEPLTFDDDDKEFLKKIKKQHPDDIILLNEKKGKKTVFQWVKIKMSNFGLIILLKIIAHFGNYLSFYSVKHQLISEFPENFINKIELIESKNEDDLMHIIEALL